MELIENFFVNNQELENVQLACSFSRFVDQLGAVHHDVKAELPLIQKAVFALIHQLTQQDLVFEAPCDFSSFVASRTVIKKVSAFLLSHFKTN
jgi:hypothetical protein